MTQVAREAWREAWQYVRAQEAVPGTYFARGALDHFAQWLGSESTEPRQRALCGEPWDRFGVSAGPICDGCEAEYRRRHPTWPLPGGAS